MKKTFTLDHPKIKLPRVVDSVKHEIKKYLKRERNKTLPEGAKYWGFDCKIGESEEVADEVLQTELSKELDALVASGIKTVYIEILAVPMAFVEAPEKEESETYQVNDFIDALEDSNTIGATEAEKG